MPTIQIRNEISRLKAENDLSAKQFYIVEMSTAGNVDVCDADTDTPLGFLTNAPAAGGEAAVSGTGSIAIGIASGALTYGAWGGTDAAGKIEAKSSAGDWVICRILEAAAADGDQISVLQVSPFQLHS